jgi:hypothetical protein
MKMYPFVGMLTCGLCAFGADTAQKDSLLNSDTVVWAGLDYSMTKMIGPGQFNNPNAIFPGMLESWNNLFLRERLGFLAKDTGKKVTPDVAGVTAANSKAGGHQIVASPGPEDGIEQSHITPEIIAKAVKSYKMESKNGLGLVYIVDRLVKVGKEGHVAVYVVYFDIDTRKVISSERQSVRTTGGGFRNYWFGGIKKINPKAG